MIDLFYTGSPFFMGILTLLLLIMLALAVMMSIQIFTNQVEHSVPESK